MDGWMDGDLDRTGSEEIGSISLILAFFGYGMISEWIGRDMDMIWIRYAHRVGNIPTS